MYEFEPIDALFAAHFGKTEEKLFFMTLMKSARSGHFCLDLSDEASLHALFEESSKEERDALISGVLEVSRFIKEEENIALHRLGQKFYLKRNWDLETGIIEEVSRLTSYPPKYFSQSLDLHRYNPQQQEAIQRSLGSSFSLISGGPGTGKTFTAAGIVTLFTKQFIEKEARAPYCILCAPTGKAASRLKESLAVGNQNMHIECGTIHALLETPRTGRSEGKMIQADLLIVDECSMIDGSIFHLLLKNITSRTCTILLGDPNQLPAVEGGSVFSDLECIGRTHGLPMTSHLSQCVRSDREALLKLASAVEQGKSGDVLSQFDKPSNEIKCIDLDEMKSEEVSALLSEQVRSLLFAPFYLEKPSIEVFSKGSAFRILSSVRQGGLGVEALNRRIEADLLKQWQGESWFAAPIILVKTDYNLKLSNGEMGILFRKMGDNGAFSSDKKENFALFEKDGKVISIHHSLLPSYELGYALSIHKSQGSEYDELAILLPQGTTRFGREIFYTAITRAKKRIHLFANRETVEKVTLSSSRKLSGIRERMSKTLI